MIPSAIIALGAVNLAMAQVVPQGYYRNTTTPATSTGTPTPTPGDDWGSEGSEGHPGHLGDFQFFGCFSSRNGFRGFQLLSSEYSNSLDRCAAICPGRFFGTFQS
jgi:hypothetical protein